MVQAVKLLVAGHISVVEALDKPKSNSKLKKKKKTRNPKHVVDQIFKICSQEENK